MSTCIRRQLQEEWEKFKSLPPPPFSADGELGAIGCQLAELDSFAAGLVSSYLGGGSVHRDLTRIDQTLDAAIASFQPTNEEEQSLLEQYRAYKRQIDELMMLLGRCISEVNP